MFLDRILQHKAEEIAELTAPRRTFSAALKRSGLSVIGEIKRASPSKGIINGGVDPLQQLRLYQQGGADAVSILTDRAFFGGGPEDFRALRARTELPLLRKDFLVSEVQIYESLFLGADALLLIAAARENERLEALLSLTYSLGMEAIVEVHTEEELYAVLETDATILGFNNRDLTTFAVDLRTTARLMAALRSSEGEGSRIVVAESGVRNEEDAGYLAESGVDAILVGEALMRASDPEETLRSFKRKGRRAA